MTLVMELVPISALLTIVTTQVLETAVAAHDLLFEKESFRTLSKYLRDIQPVLVELRQRDLKDSEAARNALESLRTDVKAAKTLVDRCKSKSQFYLLVHCRAIVKDIQRVTRDIGKSLALLSLASSEVSTNIRENVHRLQSEMQNAKFEASQSQQRIMEKLESGIRQNKTDQGFANDLIREIATAVGVPVHPSDIYKELVSFKREKEEAAEQKEREEASFMGQVIALLSQAEAANNREEADKIYRERLLSLGSTVEEEEDIEPLQSFLCPLKKDVMNDPVSLCTGTTCEREEIHKWFEAGHKHDPETNEVLTDFSLRPNIPLKQSIEEWVERNYCLKIKASKANLLSGDGGKQKDSLAVLQKLCEEKRINKDWIAIEGLIPTIIDLLAKSHHRDAKREALLTLKSLVTDNWENKSEVVDAGGVEQAVRCLSRDAKISKPALDLLHELLYNGSERNVSVYRKLSQEKSAIMLLVTHQNGPVAESEEKATVILEELSDNDDNKVRMAAAHWYNPLIDCLHKGSDVSKVKMASVIADMDLTEQSLRLLGERGVIVPLVEMLSGTLEAKASALGALDKLSRVYENKKCIADLGAVPLILEYLFASKFSIVMRERAAKIFERLMSKDGINFLLDEHSALLDLQTILPNMLCLLKNMQKNPSSNYMSKHVINALLGMVSANGGNVVRRLLRELDALPILLSLTEISDKNVSASTIKVISCISQDGSNEEISEFLLKNEKVHVLVDYLEDDSTSDAQTAAAQILANLPSSDDKLNVALIQSEALTALMEMLKNGSSEAKESALGALIRFTDPLYVETQLKVGQLGIYPILISMLYSGSKVARERATVAVHNLSLSTPRLSVAPVNKGCFFIMHTKTPTCKVHLGPCDVKNTLCLVKANALPALVKLLQENEDGVVVAAVKALATLVSEDEILRKGAHLLHEVNAIDCLVGILSNGSRHSKEEALKILERLFTLKEILQSYGAKTRDPLVSLATQTPGDAALRKKAAKLLAKLDIGQQASSIF